MPAAPRIAPGQLFAPEEWAPFQSRSAVAGPLLVLHCWGVIALAVALGIWIPWLIPLSVMIIGTRQLGLAILMHEAAHGALSRNLKLNDFLGHWLCAVPVGASLGNYRPYHLSHHRFAQQAEDPDLILSAPFPVSPASLRRKLIRDLAGQTFFKQRVLLPLAALKQSRAQAATLCEPSDSAPKRPTDDHAYEALVTGRSILPFLLVNAGLLAVFSLAGVWWAYFALWLLPMATWFPMVTRIRNIAEHACVEGSAEDAFRAARTTRANWLERAFIAPYWVNFHAEHHLFMWVNSYKLPALHKKLDGMGLLHRMEIAPSYLSVLREASRKRD
ncbi:fatty acid desaturase family protein [Brevundimonas sp. A19_0]|uniref:fatty acid desaturase family protein n=1 Tax=Brevundimonas sp. A19_0 TaxID=2821087 RepID=UPI001ADB8D0B|nr:fatty acid desaturase family protein [Brevundimonas sp. A19_0]MBO9500980.1 fatty acid desaturase family protein [Brevundimonas sp. A19_0]